MSKRIASLADDPKAQAKLLTLIADTTSVDQAAREVGYNRKTVYRLRQTDPDFAARFNETIADRDDARADFVDVKVQEWALADDAPPVLKIFWAKRWNHAYRDQVNVQHTGSNGGPIPVEVNGGRITGISEVFELARAVGAGLQQGLGTGSARGALPAAEDVLSEPADG